MIPAPKENKPTGLDYRILCARFYTSIKAWYDNPDNKRRFEEWQKRRAANDTHRAATPTATV